MLFRLLPVWKAQHLSFHPVASEVLMDLKLALLLNSSNAADNQFSDQ